MTMESDLWAAINYLDDQVFSQFSTIMGKEQLKILRAFFGRSNILVKWIDGGVPVLPTSLGPILGFAYNLDMQAAAFKTQHVNRCKAFIGPIADGDCIFIQMAQFDNLTGTLTYMARLCMILFSLLAPFYEVCQT